MVHNDLKIAEAARRIGMKRQNLHKIYNQGRCVVEVDGKVDVGTMIKIKQSREGIEGVRYGKDMLCSKCCLLGEGRICGVSGYVRTRSDVCCYL